MGAGEQCRGLPELTLTTNLSQAGKAEAAPVSSAWPWGTKLQAN